MGRLSKRPDINSSHLLCALFTLMPEDILFLNSSLKVDFCHNTQGKDYILLNMKSLRELQSVLNNNYLRQLAYSLVGSVSRPGVPSVLLSQFLRKFNNNYQIYFLANNKDYGRLPDERELNRAALKTLYFLIGI